MPRRNQASSRRRSMRRRPNRSVSTAYQHRAVAHVQGATADYAVGSDGATTNVFGSVGSPTSTVSGVILDPFGLDTRAAAIAANFAEWKLNAVSIEYVQRTSASANFAIGWSDDPGVNITATFARCAALEASRVFNLGSGMKQVFRFRPRAGWLRTSSAGESTIASHRLTSAGVLLARWDAAPSSGNYGALLIKYDLSFRSPCVSQTVNIVDGEIRIKLPERDGDEKTSPSSTFACLHTDMPSHVVVGSSSATPSGEQGSLRLAPLARQVTFAPMSCAAAAAAGASGSAQLQNQRRP